MQAFLGNHLNWVLAAAALALWGGSLSWYFYRPIRDAWRARFNEWL